MKISLPISYSYKDVAEVKDGILYIYRNGFFNDLMYDLTYAIKDSSKCYYCHKPLTREKSTLDHIYPRDLGGLSIPDNLNVSCSSCNSAKGNMLEDEFMYYLSLSKSLRKEFARDVLLIKSFAKKWYVPILPKDWISNESIEKVMVYFYLGQGVNGRSYSKVEKFYKKYGHLPRPIIVDRNFTLLDGFNTLLFAKNNSIFIVPTVILENVELQ